MSNLDTIIKPSSHTWVLIVGKVFDITFVKRGTDGKVRYSLP